MSVTKAGPPASPWVVLASTSLAVFAVFLDTTILFVAFAAIGKDFASVSASSLSWVLNAYTIVFAATLIPAGKLADRIGRRRTFLIGVVLFTVASVLCGAAPSPAVLVGARMLQALGAAALVPSSLALVLQTFPKAKVPQAVAIWAAVGAVAGAVGPTLGALVVQHLGWRWAFYVNLPVGVVSFFLGRRVLPAHAKNPDQKLPDALGVVLLVAAMSSMAYAIVRTDEWEWTSAPFVATFGASVALLAAFVVRCARVDHPLLDLDLFRSPSFRLANSAMFVFSIGFSAMFLGNILFLTRVWHLTVLRAGLVMSAGPLVVATTAPLFGRLAGRIGQRTLLLLGSAVWSVSGLLLMSVSTATAGSTGRYVATVMFTGLGVALSMPQLSSASVQDLPPASLGAGSAVNQAVRNLGATLGVALVIAFTARASGEAAVAGFHRTWWLLVISGACMLALSAALPRRRRVPPSPTVVRLAESRVAS